MSNYMTNRTKIEDLLTTRKQLLTEAATCVADAVIDRQKNSGIGNVDSNVNDIEKLIAGFSEDEKVKIMEIALVKVAANGKFGHSSDSGNGKKKTDYSKFIGGGRY